METKTTVTIDHRHDKILSKLCTQNQTTKKQFLCAAILYFEKYGISPLSHESPTKEMDKLIKRIDQIVGFIRTQEQKILVPALEAIVSSEERIKIYLDDIATKQDLSDRFQLVSVSLQESKSILSQTKLAQEQGFKILAKLIDAKERTGVFIDLSKAYQQS